MKSTPWAANGRSGFLRQITAIVALTLLGACVDQNDDKTRFDRDVAAQLARMKQAEAAKQSQPPTVVIADADKGRACRAIIASLNGRQPDIIRVVSHEGDQYRVRYTRDDGTVWTNDCIVGNGTAQWRMVEKGQPGRWRNEDTINFTVDGEKIDVQTYMDGEPITSDSYSVK